MHMVVLDGYALNPGDLSWEGFEQYGSITIYDRTPKEAEEIANRIGDAEIVLTNKTPITEEVLNVCGHIRYIGVLATGYDQIALHKARERGITVTHIPAYGTESVSQFAIGLLLEICHHIGAHDLEVKRGRWSSNQDWCFWDYPLIELKGKTMGIVGFGRIGKQTAAVAHALGMKILFYDTDVNENTLSEYGCCSNLQELYGNSDVIVLHCPLTEDNAGMINRNSIQKMKDGVIIINNARGGLIAEHDLAEALKSGKVYAAGLDVVTTEPMKEDHPLLTAPNCMITPHISWAAKESRFRLMQIALENLKAYLSGQPVHVIS